MDGGSWHCTGDRDQDHPHGKEMQKSKMAAGEGVGSWAWLEWGVLALWPLFGARPRDPLWVGAAPGSRFLGTPWFLLWGPWLCQGLPGRWGGVLWSTKHPPGAFTSHPMSSKQPYEVRTHFCFADEQTGSGRQRNESVWNYAAGVSGRTGPEMWVDVSPAPSPMTMG